MIVFVSRQQLEQMIERIVEQKLTEMEEPRPPETKEERIKAELLRRKAEARAKCQG